MFFRATRHLDDFGIGGEVSRASACRMVQPPIYTKSYTEFNSEFEIVTEKSPAAIDRWLRETTDS